MANRGQEIKISLKDRIAALGLDGRGVQSGASSPITASSNPSNPLTYGTSSSQAPFAGVRDKAARFESIGGVPVPRGSFGLGAPPQYSQNRKAGELYGNRIPSSSRSPGGSPGRSPAEDSANVDFSRVRLRSFTSDGSMDESSEANSAIKVEVVPPTPAFPGTDSKKDDAPLEEDKVVSKITSSPEPAVQEVVSEITVLTTRPSTDDTQAVDTGQETVVPEATQTLELEVIPESPATNLPLTTIDPPLDKSPAAPRRRSFILAQPPPSNVARRLSAHSSDRPTTPPTAERTATPRSDTLSPESITSPRRARSLAPSRASSISSNSSVFTAPPSDQGEISGGGKNYSPTLATVNASRVGMDVSESPVLGSFNQTTAEGTLNERIVTSGSTSLSVSTTLPATQNDRSNRSKSPMSDLPELAAAIDSYLNVEPVEGMMPEAHSESIPEDTSSEGGIGNLLQHEIINSTNDFFYKSEQEEPRESGLTSKPDHDRKSSLPYLASEEGFSETSSVSPSQTSSPPARIHEAMAETASPARVLRELRQFGMDKMSSIAIPPARSSVLSMRLPVAGSEGSPSTENPLRDSPLSHEEQPSTARPSPTNHSSPLTRGHSASASFNTIHSSPLVSSSRPVSSEPEEKKDVTVDLSPSAASMISSSGTSNASHVQNSSLQASVDVPIRSDSLPTSNMMSSTPKRSDSYSPATAQKSSIPFVTDSAPDTSRNLTPSPPPSFRSLYASGQLPPSSRGPGPHLPSTKVPLIQRAVTLMSRALPPVPKDEAAPRRSTSAFHVLRSRTSSKVKKKAADEASIDVRSSISSITTTDHAGKPRLRTKSTPSDRRTSVDAPPPPIPQLPPVVIVNDSDDSTPIARMFIEQRKLSQSRSEPQAVPQTAIRSGSPSPSLSSTQASISSATGPVHLFTPSFDTGIFDSFPDVPHELPTSSMVARHAKATGPGRSRLGIMSNHSSGDLEGQRDEYNDGLAHSKSEDGHGTIKSPQGSKIADEFGQADQSRTRDLDGNPQSPVRKKQASRKLIPGWYDEDGDPEDEKGWANVSIVRRRLA